MAENVIKKESIILVTKVATDSKSAPSNYPYILSHTLSRYDFKHVFGAVAADNSAGVGDKIARLDAIAMEESDSDFNQEFKRSTLAPGPVKKCSSKQRRNLKQSLSKLQ